MVMDSNMVRELSFFGDDGLAATNLSQLTLPSVAGRGKPRNKTRKVNLALNRLSEAFSTHKHTLSIVVCPVTLKAQGLE